MPTSTPTMADSLRAHAGEPWMTIGAKPFALEAAAEIERLTKERDDLRRALEKGGEYFNDLTADLYSDGHERPEWFGNLKGRSAAEHAAIRAALTP